MMVVNVAILFLPRASAWDGALRLALICALVNLPCIALWAMAGDRMRAWMKNPLALRMFNYGMALLLAATAAWIVYDESFAA